MVLAPMLRHRLDLCDLLDVYRLTFEVLVEAALQMPFAIADEGERLGFGLFGRG